MLLAILPDQPVLCGEYFYPNRPNAFGIRSLFAKNLRCESVGHWSLRWAICDSPQLTSQSMQRTRVVSQKNCLTTSCDDGYNLNPNLRRIAFSHLFSYRAFFKENVYGATS